MQQDLKWFATIPLQGISCYAEPGDWFTYELNHYILAKLEWNPHVKLDSLITEYCRGRFGHHWKEAKEAMMTLEMTVRFFGNIRNTKLKSTSQIDVARRQIQRQIKYLQKVQTSASSELSENVDKLILMLQYANADLNIQVARASGVEGEVIMEKLKELMLFQLSNAGKGIIIYNPNINLDQLHRHYNR
jgi:hypothetical protein